MSEEIEKQKQAEYGIEVDRVEGKKRRYAARSTVYPDLDEETGSSTDVAVRRMIEAVDAFLSSMETVPSSEVEPATEAPAIKETTPTQVVVVEEEETTTATPAPEVSPGPPAPAPEAVKTTTAKTSPSKPPSTLPEGDCFHINKQGDGIVTVALVLDGKHPEGEQVYTITRSECRMEEARWVRFKERDAKERYPDNAHHAHTFIKACKAVREHLNTRSALPSRVLLRRVR